MAERPVSLVLMLPWAALLATCDAVGTEPTSSDAGSSGNADDVGANAGTDAGALPSSTEDNPIESTADAACTNAFSCVVLRGRGKDASWREDRRRECEAFGLGRSDAPGVWEESGSCPDGAYFASCVGADREEYHLLVGFDTNPAELQERCVAADMEWELHEDVVPRAYRSAEDVVAQPTPSLALHPEVLTVAVAQLCSTNVPDGLVGVIESDNPARYFHFVCISGSGHQSPFHFTQALSERYELVSDVPDAALQLVILELDGTHYFVTGESCWNCGETFTVHYPDGVGTSSDVLVTDTAGRERSFPLTSVSSSPP